MTFKSSLQVHLRKINSILAIIIILFLLSHSILLALSMVNIISYSLDFKEFGFILFYLVFIHLLISLYLCFEKKLKNKNVKLNYKVTDTAIQLVSGILMVVLIVLHIYYIIISPVYLVSTLQDGLIHIILDNLVAISILVHLSVSIPRLLVSLGFLIGENDYKHATSVSNILLIVFLLIIFICEVSYFVL
ncbi:MAG: hypothetical protein MJ203_04210 [archaeon]|nr:hypothetical protein [archaeon]